MYIGSIQKKCLKIILILFGFTIFGCTQNESEPTQTPEIKGKLIPYATKTQSRILDPTTISTISATIEPDVPTPTNTPITYEVVENDTLIGIAVRYDIELENLVAANPGIDPNFLAIGMTLTIPIDGNISTIVQPSTPIPIIVRKPICYPQIDNSLQCISKIENNQSFAVENVIVEITIQSPQGSDLVSQVVITPQNIIPAGQMAAVAVNFPIPSSSDNVAVASLLSVFPVSIDDQRYVETELHIEDVKIISDGKQAKVRGSVEFPAGQNGNELQTIRSVWVTSFAYDAQDNIVGIRKWVADGNISGASIEFKFDVYSVGPAINHIEFLTEARP